MTGIYLYDDARARAFEPFALTRPVWAMRAGAALIHERWHTALQLPVHGALVAPHLSEYAEPWANAPSATTGEIPAGAIVANSRCVPALGIIGARAVDATPVMHGDVRVSSSTGAIRCDGRIAAVRLPRQMHSSDFDDGRLDIATLASPELAVEDIRGCWMDEVWDFIRCLPDQLRADIEWIAQNPLRPKLGRAAQGRPYYAAPPEHSVVIGEHPVYVAQDMHDSAATVLFAGARIEPHVVFDATDGPILVSRGAVVHPFTRLCGPCFVGEGSTVNGDTISCSSIGPVCKVRGEVSNTIFLGHCNKGHDGFVGHSYLGRWVNLGAGTITSNLKNTYGPVSLWTPGGVRETGMQFLGTLFGDHAKTAIGTRLTTGSVLGAGANAFGSGMAPKCVPPFAWGYDGESKVYELDHFLDVAERMMARRHVTLDERGRRLLAAAHAARWSANGAKSS